MEKEMSEMRAEYKLLRETSASAKESTVSELKESHAKQVADMVARHAQDTKSKQESYDHIIGQLQQRLDSSVEERSRADQQLAKIRTEHSQLKENNEALRAQAAEMTEELRRLRSLNLELDSKHLEYEKSASRSSVMLDAADQKVRDKEEQSVKARHNNAFVKKKRAATPNTEPQKRSRTEGASGSTSADAMATGEP